MVRLPDATRFGPGGPVQELKVAVRRDRAIRLPVRSPSVIKAVLSNLLPI